MSQFNRGVRVAFVVLIRRVKYGSRIENHPR